MRYTGNKDYGTYKVVLKKLEEAEELNKPVYCEHKFKKYIGEKDSCVKCGSNKFVDWKLNGSN